MRDERMTHAEWSELRSELEQDLTIPGTFGTGPKLVGLVEWLLALHGGVEDLVWVWSESEPDRSLWPGTIFQLGVILNAPLGGYPEPGTDEYYAHPEAW